MIKKLIYAVIFFAPFTTWLALSGWLRLPVILILTLMVLALPLFVKNLFKQPAMLMEDKDDYLLIFFLAFVWISFFCGYFNSRSFNHSLSYTFSIFFYFLFFKFLIRVKGIREDQLAKIATYSVIFTNLIIVLEWTLINFFDVGIRYFFLTGGESTYNMHYYFRGFFISVAGPGEEPGGTASLINIYFPIGLWYLKSNSKKIFWYVVLYILSTAFLTSVAGILIIITSLIFVNIGKLKNILKHFWLIITITIISLTIIYYFNIFSGQIFIEKFYDYVEEKATLSNSNYSSLDRKTKSRYALEDWMQSPFIGNGPGYGVEKHRTGYFNAFLTLLADTGFIGFSLFSLFLIFVFLKLLKFKGNDRLYFLFSFYCLILHSFIYYVYYHEPLWLSIILIQLLYKSKYAKKRIKKDYNSDTTSKNYTII